MPEPVPNPSKWWAVLCALGILAALYCVFFTSWGRHAHDALGTVMLVGGFGIALYLLVHLLYLRLRARHAARFPQSELAPPSVLQPAQTPFFHDDPTRIGRSGIGRPALMDYGIKKPASVTVLLTAAACMVHYLSARPSRGQALLGIGFLCAVVFYLWLLFRFGRGAYHWMKQRYQHPAAATANAPSSPQGPRI